MINRLSIETNHFSHSVEPLYAKFLAQIEEIKIDYVFKLKGNILF